MENKANIRDILKFLDNFIYDFLKQSVDFMPIRLAKYIAIYYTDARIRKLYSKYIGVSMGEGTYANLGMKVVPNGNKICVCIGQNTSIAPNVTFICLSSANNGIEINELDYVKNRLIKSGDIVVDDEVWIGANVTILPNVSIGKCSIIGAGSVVINDVEPYSIYAGVPAKKIRDLKTGERIKGDVNN
jgi:acetyltransferase-like isoleucine patch superfamily enzyme